MEQVARFGSWGELYVMLGTSSAALIGLLFVATSLHVDEIVNNAIYRTLARSSSMYLLATLAEAACILTPQPPHVLGVEITVLNLAALSVVGRNFIHFLDHPDLSQHGGLRIYRGLLFIGAFVTGIGGGLALFAGRDWALYPVTVSSVVVIIAVALTAWAIMLGVGQGQGKSNRRARRRAR